MMSRVVWCVWDGGSSEREGNVVELSCLWKLEIGKKKASNNEISVKFILCAVLVWA